MLASRRDLPKLPLLLDRRPRQLWTLEWRHARPPLSRRRQCATSLTSDVVFASTHRLGRRRAVLAKAKDRTFTPRAAEATDVWNQASPLMPQHTMRKHLCHYNDLLKSVSRLPLPRSLKSARTVCPLHRLDPRRPKRGSLSEASRVTARTAGEPYNMPTLADGSSTASASEGSSP